MRNILGVIFLAVVFLSFNVLIFSFPPSSFPREETIKIKKGSTLSQTAETLFQGGVIKSVFWFKVVTTLNGGARGVIAGDYYFHRSQSLSRVSQRVVSGEEGLVPIKMTVPEGLSVFQVADLFGEHFSLFDRQEFVEFAPEGYLFPDTYFFFSNITARDVIERMTANFNERVGELRIETEEQEKDFRDIVTMASIIEEETHNSEDKPIISGILWKRIEIDMALQVDVTFSYVNGKNTYTLSREDLREESPYNTYINRGLPPGPISNPGLDSLEAALYPTETDYLYFLSDLSGNMYYAEDFDGHQVNRELYLRK